MIKFLLFALLSVPFSQDHQEHTCSSTKLGLLTRCNEGEHVLWGTMAYLSKKVLEGTPCRISASVSCFLEGFKEGGLCCVLDAIRK